MLLDVVGSDRSRRESHGKWYVKRFALANVQSRRMCALLGAILQGDGRMMDYWLVAVKTFVFLLRVILCAVDMAGLR